MTCPSLDSGTLAAGMAAVCESKGLRANPPHQNLIVFADQLLRSVEGP